MKTKVLIVEDDPDTMEIARVILNLHDYDVVWVENPVDVVGRIREENPDLVILDLSMRPKSGWELFKEIREGGVSGIPLVAFTAYSCAEDEHKIKGFGFDGFIPKPCKPERIVQEVRRFFP